jgi:hypothetical protein
MFVIRIILPLLSLCNHFLEKFDHFAIGIFSQYIGGMDELKSRVQSAGKVFTILEALANSPKGELGISDLADILKWNRTTVIALYKRY